MITVGGIVTGQCHSWAVESIFFHLRKDRVVGHRAIEMGADDTDHHLALSWSLNLKGITFNDIGFVERVRRIGADPSANRGLLTFVRPPLVGGGGVKSSVIRVTGISRAALARRSRGYRHASR